MQVWQAPFYPKIKPLQPVHTSPIHGFVHRCCCHNGCRCRYIKKVKYLCRSKQQSLRLKSKCRCGQVCSTWCCSLGTLQQQQLSALRVVKVHSVALSVRDVLATGRVGQSPRVGTAWKAARRRQSMLGPGATVGSRATRKSQLWPKHGVAAAAETS